MKAMPSGSSRDPHTASFLRVARCADLSALADLWVASWQAAMPGIDFAARRNWFFDYVREIERQGGATICAFRGEHLLGFILLDQGRGVLEQIAVSPELFGSGIGALLLDEAKRLCPSGFSLEVNADNPRALRFYEKAGFARQEPGVNPASGLKTWLMRWPGLTG
jgi:putative acetyltransferase